MLTARKSLVIAAALVLVATLAGAVALRAQQAVAREQLQAQLLAEPPPVPASLDEGRKVFEKICAACHKFGAIGADIGPDLTTMTSRLKKQDVVESILWPSKVISDQFEMTLIETRSGGMVSGMVQRENAQAVFVVTSQAPDKPIRLLKSQIAERRKSTVSMMPEGLIDTLSVREASSLVAFLLGRPPR